MSDEALAARWPGKSPMGDAGVAHPAIYHMLDVGAVAEVLACEWRLEPQVRDALVLLAAIHDLGKVGRAFRAMLQQRTPQEHGAHWEVTEAYLRLFDAELLGHRLGGYEEGRHHLYAAAAGHHGRPPWRDLPLDRRGTGPAGCWKRMIDAAGEDCREDACSIIKACLELWPHASIKGLPAGEVLTLSWRLAGLTTAADWIASNVDWFPPTPPGPTLVQHLAESRRLAPTAVALAGLKAPTLRTDGTLFDFQPRPMQQACSQFDLPEGPMVAVIEDETGNGKTEAALLLARRMMQAEKGRGLYFALPTMATADSTIQRVSPVLSRIYAGTPSLVLAHGRATLAQGWRDIVDVRDSNPDEPLPTEWLADNRRRALLGNVGVGTIDQALLAVVRAKHAVLRQFGLSSKILIVDEVHEVGDPYMGELLERLLDIHARLGGSAILLSATLPIAQRQRLLAAFERGAGREAPSVADTAYPALTVPRVAVPQIAAHPSRRGPVEVVRLDHAEGALAVLRDAAADGAACVWVRNSVDEAIAGYRALHAAGVPTDLLHARFALVDRKRHEMGTLATFGKDRAARPGRVLVATQVVESSLDLDFDVMVSDLAPMAALIQRAGRLWRHMDLRPAQTRPVARPILHVVSPDPAGVVSARWLEPAIGTGAFVYGAAEQWRTARVLFDKGRIDAPEGLRELIEAAGADHVDLPACLERSAIDAEGKAGAGKAHALGNRIDWGSGYRLGAKGDSDSEFPTRLGEEQRILVLCRSANGTMRPWAGDTWSVEACQMSEVQASKRRLGRAVMTDDFVPPHPGARLPDWLLMSRTFVVVDNCGTISGSLSYSADLGLIFTA